MKTPRLKLDLELSKVEAAEDRNALLPLWQKLNDRPIPKNMSLQLMKLAIAYQLQVKAKGGLNLAVRRHLHEVAKGSNACLSPPTLKAKPGTRLVRQWHGVLYEGVIEARHVFINGKTYRSLSEAAKAITGAHWSGPRFFGIKTGTSS